MCRLLTDTRQMGLNMTKILEFNIRHFLSKALIFLVCPYADFFKGRGNRGLAAGRPPIPYADALTETLETDKRDIRIIGTKSWKRIPI